ncbi:hypothetical protein JB92DRAFT_2826813 [Gautieria morchelliformis]|nr:hypothetical protein JB92DRAFT_2826813 [Gautieria morchelliformis]
MPERAMASLRADVHGPNTRRLTHIRRRAAADAELAEEVGHRQALRGWGSVSVRGRGKGRWEAYRMHAIGRNTGVSNLLQKAPNRHQAQGTCATLTYKDASVPSPPPACPPTQYPAEACRQHRAQHDSEAGNEVREACPHGAGFHAARGVTVEVGPAPVVSLRCGSDANPHSVFRRPSRCALAVPDPGNRGNDRRTLLGLILLGEFDNRTIVLDTWRVARARHPHLPPDSRTRGKSTMAWREKGTRIDAEVLSSLIRSRYPIAHKYLRLCRNLHEDRDTCKDNIGNHVRTT